MEFLRRLIISVLCAAIGTTIFWWATNQGMTIGTGAMFGLFVAVCLSALVIDNMIRNSVNEMPAAISDRGTSKSKSKQSDTPKHVPTGNREEGAVKWFNSNKGYGFIARDAGGEIFVHYRSIQGDGRRVLRDGQRVEFEVSEGEKGPQAEEVTIL